MYPTSEARCVARVAIFSWRFIIPLTFFVFCYWKIFAALRRNNKVADARRSIHVRQREQHAAGPSTSAAAAAAAAAGSRSKPVNNSQRNVIKTMIAVTSCFIVCWLPVQFTIVSRLCGLQSFRSQTLYYALAALAFANFTANPLIYATGLYQFLRVKCTTFLYQLRHAGSQMTNSAV